jgi:NADPH:quinone reductase-like Zn-dependent oxidoreductase
MKAAVCDGVGQPLHVVDDYPKPSPGPDELLVKSLYLSMNPVYVKSPYARATSIHMKLCWLLTGLAMHSR